MSGVSLGRAHVFPVVLGLAAMAAALVVPALESAEARPATGSSAPRPVETHAATRASTKPAAATAKQKPALRRNTQPFWLDTPGGGRAVVYPPKHAGKQPLAVMLHGMCDVPENECPWLAPAVTPHAWLVCPRASVACRGGGATWSTSREKKTVSAAVDGLVAARPGDVDTTDGTLMGFSQGAYAAFNIARTESGQWSRLLLIAAKVYPSDQRLKNHGVKRVLFAAGDYDMTHGPMWTAAKRLSHRGYPARFMSLGKVGHTFPGDMTKRMTDAVSWLKL